MNRAVNDGQWHHVIAEADRTAATFGIYLDGKRYVGGPGLGADVSLARQNELTAAAAP